MLFYLIYPMYPTLDSLYHWLFSFIDYCSFSLPVIFTNVKHDKNSLKSYLATTGESDQYSTKSLITAQLTKVEMINQLVPLPLRIVSVNFISAALVSCSAS